MSEDAGRNDNQGFTAKSQEQVPHTPTLVSPPLGMWSGEAPVGSMTTPSETGKYRMVLRDYAATAQIEGGLVALDYNERDVNGNEVTKTVLCQVSRMSSRNRHHENPILGALLRERGRIPGLSGFADQKEVDLLPMDTIVKGTNKHEMPRSIPPTGTDIRLASKADVANFSDQHQALFNIGHLYGAEVPIGLMLKHFGSGEDGWGDAHMLGVFGATGSGKTVMAASIIAGFAARREMGMLIVDPQGQFSGFEFGKDTSKWSWRLDEAFRLVGRGPDVRVVSVNNIALESPSLFAHLLQRYKFFDAFGFMGHDKKEQIVHEFSLFLDDILREKKRENPNFTLGELELDQEVVQEVAVTGAGVYADAAKKREKLQEEFQQNPRKGERAKRIWEQVREMFSKPYKLGDLLDDVLINRKIIILNVDVDDSIKDLYCAEILDGIKKKAEFLYRIQQGIFWTGDPARKYKGVETNALIVIDEAHRFAPQSSGKNDDQEKMRATLVDAIRTTRKLSVGWCHVTQSIADFDKGIFRQIQTKILGVGIGTGVDNEHLETALNRDKDLIDRYRALPRPLTTGVFPFAIIGELVALGNGSRALFVSAPKTQKELIDLNPNHFKYLNGAPVRVASENNATLSAKRLTTGTKMLPPSDDEEDSIPF